jgi:hypothetical protein
LVNRAKKLLREIETHQAEIAKLALQVCTIRHGGRSNGFYTITDFARDIGIERKTLSHWVSIYRDILSRIDIAEPTKEEWSAGGKALRLLNSAKTIENSLDGTPRVKKRKLSDAPVAELKGLFQRIQDRPEGDIVKIDRLYRSAKHFRSISEEIPPGRSDLEKLRSIWENLNASLLNINEKIQLLDASTSIQHLS